MDKKAKPEKAVLRVIPTEKYFAHVRALLSKEGQAYVRVTGVSMMPLLHHLRDGVVIVPPGRVAAGDIVLFSRENGRYALHRVIGVRGDTFTMAGDNQWHIEKNLPCSRIVGVVSMLHRSGRFISCEKISVKMYARVVTLWTKPRIFLRRAVRFLMKSFRNNHQSKEFRS